MHDVHSNPNVRVFGDRRLLNIGHKVRIDDYCIISIGSEGIEIGDHVHIGAGCYLYGGGGRITLCDFSGLSPRSVILTASDDFTDGYMAGPTLPTEYRKVTGKPIYVGRHAIVGCATVLLPGARLEDYSTVGAMSLVKHIIPEGQIAAGCPARVLRPRNVERVLRLERQLRQEEDQQCQQGESSRSERTSANTDDL